VLLSEPPKTPYDVHFTLLGIPMRIHPMFWLMTLILGANSRDARSLLIWMVAVLISITFHELGHAAAFRAYGLFPWITLHGFGGVTSCNPGQSRGGRGFRPFDQILISFAGPAAGFVLAGAIALAMIYSGHQVEVSLGAANGVSVRIVPLDSPILSELVWQLLWVNIAWGVMNLLPVYPLDGGQITQSILVMANPQDGVRQSLMLSTFTAVLVAGLAILRWHDFFLALLFGYLGYLSFTALQAYSGRGRWQ
jgi:stage IV sporulation protein FB